MGDMKFFTNAIMGAVLFTLAFLTGNTLRQSLQDRSREFATLKAVGYSGRSRAEPRVRRGAAAVPAAGTRWALVIARRACAALAENFGQIRRVACRRDIRDCSVPSALALIGAALPAASLSRMPVAFALGKR